MEQKIYNLLKTKNFSILIIEETLNPNFAIEYNSKFSVASFNLLYFSGIF